jgi:hypothetical protein
MIDPANPEKGSKYSPTRLLDFELEVALVVGGCTNIECVGGGHGGGGCGGGTMIGRTMTTEEAWGRLFWVLPDEQLERPQCSEVGVHTTWDIHVQDQGQMGGNLGQG